MTREVYVGRVRSLVLLSLLNVVTLTLYWFIWFWRFNGELNRHEERRASPAGRWFLFLLVPVLGWFLAVWFAGRQVRRLQIRAGAERLNVPPHAAIWAALVPIVGWVAAAAALQAGANRIWLRLHDAYADETRLERRLECATCNHAFDVLLNPLVPVPVRCPACGHAGEV